MTPTTNEAKAKALLDAIEAALFWQRVDKVSASKEAEALILAALDEATEAGRQEERARWLRRPLERKAPQE